METHSTGDDPVWLLAVSVPGRLIWSSERDPGTHDCRRLSGDARPKLADWRVVSSGSGLRRPWTGTGRKLSLLMVGRRLTTCSRDSVVKHAFSVAGLELSAVKYRDAAVNAWLLAELFVTAAVLPSSRLDVWNKPPLWVSSEQARPAMSNRRSQHT